MTDRIKIQSASVKKFVYDNIMQKAFSLVELSIALVILDLLVGRVLSGQSPIHAAELRAVTQEEQKFLAATHTFRDQYLSLPGDMTNATAFWGTSTTGCIGQANGPELTNWPSGTHKGTKPERQAALGSGIVPHGVV